LAKAASNATNTLHAPESIALAVPGICWGSQNLKGHVNPPRPHMTYFCIVWLESPASAILEVCSGSTMNKIFPNSLSLSLSFLAEAHSKQDVDPVQPFLHSEADLSRVADRQTRRSSVDCSNSLHFMHAMQRMVEKNRI